MAETTKTVDEPQVITLSKPIQANGEILTELKLQEAEIGCLQGVRLAIEAQGEGEDRLVKVHLDLGDIHKIIAGLANIPSSSAKRLRMSDAMACKEAIASFLGVSL